MSVEGQTPGMPAGWYHAEGDPPGTKRYWDGATWTSEPQVMMGDSVVQDAASRYASTGQRLGGRVIDVIITSVVGFVIALLFAADSINSTESDSFLGAAPTATAIVIGVAFAFLWDFLFTAFAGGTPGKLIVGARVAEADGLTTPPSMATAAKRAINRVLQLLGFIGAAGSGLAFGAAVLIGLVSLVMLFSDDENPRTVMDRLAGTVVVKK